MKILIFEDEIPAYEKLLKHITTEIPESKILGWARSVAEVNIFLSKHKDVDLIFSDIELMDGISFDAFEKTKVNCPIIFCTAFDQYLFQAFNTNGIAYLLKPYNQENFKAAIEKYKSLVSFSTSNISPDVIAELKTILHGDKKSYKKRFSIKKKDGIKLLQVEDIVAFKANGDFSFAFDNKGAKHVINLSIGDIEEKIDPAQFYRINRSEIVQIDFIEKIEPYFKNKLSIKMQGLEDNLYTSSAKTKEFRIWLEK